VFSIHSLRLKSEEVNAFSGSSETPILQGRYKLDDSNHGEFGG
jgi:hypothetical protein